MCNQGKVKLDSSEFSASFIIDELLENENSVYKQILADIANGNFISGDRLITTQLAQQYQTSINPVREAIKQLEGEGFVTSQKNSGAKVANFSYSAMRDVFEVLQLLEPYFLTWFGQNCTPHSLARLDELHQEMCQLNYQDSKKLRDLDTEFHWEMYRHHYNQSAIKLWKRNKLILQAMHGRLSVSEVRFKAVLKEHQHILYLLKAGDEESATRALSKHVISGGQYWSQIIVQQQEQL